MSVSVTPAPKAQVKPKVIEFPGEPPRAYTNDRLWTYWEQPVSQLCALEDWSLTEPQKERHRIYARLLMAIVHAYWNGNRNGRRGTYPLNYVKDPVAYVARPGDSVSLNGDYYGHNIGALAVDAKGKILDFDFNHNELFNSSAEHAEARLVRRLYSLAQISEAWQTPSADAKDPKAASAEAAQSLGNESTPVNVHPTKKSYTSLKEVTIYTSLESCAQCSGVMALAAVKQVVYLQTDPGTYWIGRILHRLTADPIRAPRPLSGKEIDFSLFTELDQAYKEFATKEGREAFWLPPDANPDQSVAITSFLCTAQARDMFGRGGTLDGLTIANPNFRHVADLEPDGEEHGCASSCGLTNAEVLRYARDFYDYAANRARRGTPHNL